MSLCFDVTNSLRPGVDPIRVSLEAEATKWFHYVLISCVVVALGCLLELPEGTVSIYRWIQRRRERPVPDENPKSLLIPLGCLGVLLVITGVIGEAAYEGRQATAETALRAHDEQILENAESNAAQAQASVAPLQLEAANAREEAEQAKEETQRLRAKADEAQLELARLTGPIKSVPVIDGIAAPDPTKGLRLRILLHTDVRIKLPTGSKGKATSWTLFIVQDEKGDHQFSTFPHNVMFGNFLHAAPHSFCSMELVTDEYGTTDTTFGSASCPSNQTDPIKQ